MKIQGETEISSEAGPQSAEPKPGWATLAVKMTVSLVVLTALIAGLILWQTREEMNRLLLDQARAQAKVFLIGVEREIQRLTPDLDPGRLQEVVTFASQYEIHLLNFVVEHLLIVDLSGRVLAHNDPSHIGESYADHEYLMRAIRENRDVSPAGLTYHATRTAAARPTIDVVIPLHIGDETSPPVGAMEVELDLSQSEKLLADRYREIRIAALAKLAGLMAALALLGLLALHYGVIARLKEMMRVALTISGGDLRARVRPLGSDEIGSLASLFNRMTSSLERTIQDLKQTQLLAMTKMAELAEKRDMETGAHLHRIARYSRILADELHRSAPEERIDGAFVEAVAEASPLHDIGKVATPDAVLLKQGPLTPEEFEIVKRHALDGADVLSGADFLSMARDIALAHHEKYDGTGYPNGLGGDKIPLAARIVALADVYDAIVSGRAYKRPLPHEEARAFIEKESGKRLDPRVVNAFLRREAEFMAVFRALSEDRDTSGADAPPPAG